MKLLYTLPIVVLLQLWNLKAFQALNTNSKGNESFKIDQTKLVQFYENDLRLLAKDFCAKAKQLSEEILKDTKVQQAATHELKEFKRNITHYLHNYSFYQRYGLYDKLLRIFSDMTIGYYYQQPKDKSQDSLYILKLLRHQGYDAISDEYENKFENFIKQQFLPKFEKFKQQLNKQDLEKRQGLMDSYKEIKQCLNYHCYYKNFNLLINLIETPKEELFSLINLNLERIMIFYIITANDIVAALIKDPNTTQLTPVIKVHLLKDLKDFKEKYENNTKFELLHDLILFFHNNLSIKYYFNQQYNQKDQQFIRNLFDQHGFIKLNSYNQMLFNDFVLRTLPKLFEQFRKYSSKEDLKKEDTLLKWYEDLQKLQSYEERVKAFYKFHTLYVQEKI